jgi:phospholipase A1
MAIKFITIVILLSLSYQVYAQNSFISAYRPNYILPFHYNSKIPPAKPPKKGDVKHNEVKMQISIKADLLPNMFNSNNSLYLAYSQQSFWQEYAKYGFVRENNYEPELFLSYKFNQALQQKGLKLINFGFDHQSNGEGGDRERSWERLYADMHFGSENLLFSVKPWLRISGVLEQKRYNHDITKYLGHGRLLFAYKFKNNVFSIMSRNNLESFFKHGAIELDWSFPIYKHLRGYTQLFSGYGQSLDEYNHRNNSASIGLSLSDWI